MESFVLFVLVLGFIWLAVRLSNTRNELAALRSLLHELQRRPPHAEKGKTTGEQTDPASQGQSTPTILPHQVEPPAPASQSPPPLIVLPAHIATKAPTILPLAPPVTPSAPPPLTATAPVPPQLPAEETARPSPSIDWERFMGAKLFAWLGGFALFLGIAFFIKYSFERNLIPPELRVALGFLAGLGLVIGGMVLRRKEYAVTAQTLCATGVVVLYAVSFACYGFYHFIGSVTAFALMAAVTVAAFVLAVRMDAKVVAILGLVGGFLTPPMLSTGQDQPLALFSYVAFLNAGLVALALHRRWHFVVPMGAIGTALMQAGWVVAFFRPEKVFITMAIFLGFNLFFLAAFAVCRRLGQESPGVLGSATGMPFVTLGFVALLLAHPALGTRPGVVFTFALVANLCILIVILLQPRVHPLQILAGVTAFLLLAAWTAAYLSPELLNWALALYFIFALLHSAFPIFLQRLRPGMSPAWLAHLFPPVALMLVLFPLLRQTEVSWLFWPFVLLVDLLAIGLAAATASVLAILGVLALTALVSAVWIFQAPAEISSLPSLLWIIGGFAVFFFIGSTAVEKVIGRKLAVPGGGSETKAPSPWQLQVPALSAITPFLLLIMVTARLPLADPSPVFGLALLLVALLLGVAIVAGMDAVAAVALVCVLVLEWAWHNQHFIAARPWPALAWYFGFYAVFTVFPFVVQGRVGFRVLPWAVAALAGPLHFFLVHRAVVMAFGKDYIFLLPLALAIPMLAGLWFLRDRTSLEQPGRNALLAWFGGSALFFITMIFPVQFRHEWLTLGWALEGVALLWLFHRVPHPRLRDVGIALLLVTFVRLALNPTVLSYHSRSATPVLNWYLYTYGIVSVCLLVGGRLLAPPRHQVWGVNVSGVLYSLGTILAFLLVNIEIADYFSTGTTLTFEFSENFARDMTYSIAWALFALVLLVIGIARRVAGARYASLALLSVTLIKLFFHDLSNLGQLYRIGAFIAVAIILIVASFLYQRFFSAKR